jgi:hypothetical protein
MKVQKGLQESDKGLLQELLEIRRNKNRTLGMYVIDKDIN